MTITYAQASGKVEEIQGWALALMLIGLAGSLAGGFYGFSIFPDESDVIRGASRVTSIAVMVFAVFSAVSNILLYHFLTGFSYILSLTATSACPKDQDGNFKIQEVE